MSEEFEELVVPMFDAEWEKRREGDEFAPSLGKVPILWDGEIVVWDSLAIIEFLADRYGTAFYWPEDEGARAVARSMSGWWMKGPTWVSVMKPMRSPASCSWPRGSVNVVCSSRGR